MIARVFVVRHGNTFGTDDAPRRIGGRTDLPLVVTGREQARALGHDFARRGIVFDRVVCGPLRRTRQTAQILLAAAGQDRAVTIAEWLREIDHGPDENRCETAVLARVGQPALDAWNTDAVAPDGWQVDADARRSAWRGALAAAAGTLLVVTSSGHARFALPGVTRLRTGAYGMIAVGANAPPLAVTWDVRP